MGRPKKGKLTIKEKREFKEPIQQLFERSERAVYAAMLHISGGDNKNWRYTNSRRYKDAKSFPAFYIGGSRKRRDAIECANVIRMRLPLCDDDLERATAVAQRAWEYILDVALDDLDTGADLDCIDDILDGKIVADGVLLGESIDTDIAVLDKVLGYNIELNSGRRIGRGQAVWVSYGETYPDGFEKYSLNQVVHAAIGFLLEELTVDDVDSDIMTSLYHSATNMINRLCLNIHYKNSETHQGIRIATKVIIPVLSYCRRVFADVCEEE
ncbi:MAG: hypothetical protein NWF07_13770 [Candidatus Bathyarchaeota archaeon]|nr:hypothetical protein [Candidatus Bathyarchaeota archaeon]